MSTRRLKLTTRPSTIATDRRHVPFGVAVASGAATPATNTMGSTGKMHGDMPAINPAANATKMSVTKSVLRMNHPTIATDDP
jgi:hypothetical protein